MIDKSYIELELEIKHETLGAILVTDGDIQTWLPKSVCILENEEPAENFDCPEFTCLFVKEWKAKDEGLI